MFTHRTRGAHPGLPSHHRDRAPHVASVLAEDPSQPLNQATAIPVILWAVNQAFALAARR